MKWPWRKSRSGEGASALREAREQLRETEAQWPEVRTVASSLRDIRERNHFASQIEYIFKGGA